MIVTVTTTGCTSATADRPGSTRPRNDTQAQNKGRELTGSEQVLIDRAEEQLIKKCMERERFRYWPEPVESAAERRRHSYVLDDVGWARRYGYGRQLERKAEKAWRNNPNDAYVNALPQAERIRHSKSLDGDQSGGALIAELPGGGTVRAARDGCRADAKGRLYGDFPAWFRAERTVTGLTTLYVPDLVKDKRFVNAVTAWSACMGEAGHPYDDPPEIRTKLPALADGLSPAKAHAAEVELAVAEATCATKTSLADTARALEREYRAKSLKRYREEAADHRRMGLAALAQAEDITGSTA
ncbi:hypothetical protein AB0R12_05570 [Streptomyces niveus]|uniref:hypothetical protein n=1 Tax=Streptomyces niveus TaxID=193462 RepID=UPI0034134599